MWHSYYFSLSASSTVCYTHIICSDASGFYHVRSEDVDSDFFDPKCEIGVFVFWRNSTI